MGDYGRGYRSELQRWAVSTVTPATGMVVPLEDLKLHLRVDHEDEDAYIQALGKAAVTHVEKLTSRTLLVKTLRMTLDRVEYLVDECTNLQYLPLPYPPLVSVSSVTYVDTDGTSTTWASSNYSVDTYTEPGRIVPVYGQTWPSARYQANSLTVQYLAGSTSTTGIDEGFKAAVKLLVGHWYEHRSAVEMGSMAPVPMAVQSLLGGLGHGSYTV